ncbi:DEAD/DEAH box helicase family protein [Actinomyces sp.]|uniref:restriction endonuclease n=1 Tax=Actinomyces sp. TaxID=29317 RepID=UPI0026DA7EA1|nr:DEAD/DEAH box helicase family protein [Actinomyces sp.]MDO4899183.1 DEAD/DEAH box helicase family protein [Actinomyces sp.]
MQFKFKIQDYQTEAARAVTEVFEGQPNQAPLAYLRDMGSGIGKKGQRLLQLDSDTGYGNARIALAPDALLRNVRRIQQGNQIMESASLSTEIGGICLDVEMETGTGKTYVYIKTMFELNRLYCWSKFIVVVPSIAIREGVNKTFETTEQHFFEQYGKRIRYFVYNSYRLTEIDRYSEDDGICCMIINMQAFNTSMKEGAKNKYARKIFEPQDDFQSRKPIDVIAANRPIVIQDEPQKMGGKATQDGIKRFNPLFSLSYSATIPRDRKGDLLHNLVFELDTLDAYNQRLVKRIEVKGFELKHMRGTDSYLYLQDVVVSRSAPPVAVIEHKYLGASGKVTKQIHRFNVGDSIYDASGPTKLEAYRDFTIAPDGIIPDMEGQSACVRFLNGEVIWKGEVYGDSAEEDMRRVQIRETIRSHLEKEEALFARGIKCLSLFFIDEVARYRAYGDDGEELTVGYGKVFEEEYARCVEEYLAQLPLNEPYRAYLAGISAHETHKGYFSIDKKGRAIDSTTKRGSDESDDKSAYDLILRNKERLLSFDEPTRFIFSHSALREGWDNPNIFQICALKHSDNETGKRQEVGRGLRLCVDSTGERQDLAALGEEEVHSVNVLTVVASESYSDFTLSLQSDIRSGLHARPTHVTDGFLKGKVVTMPDSTEVTFSEKESKIAYAWLLRNNYIDYEGTPTDRFREEGFNVVAVERLPEDMQAKAPAIEALVKSVYDPHALDGMVSNGLETKIPANKLNDNFERTAFQELWGRIHGKYAYTVEFDSAELVEHAVARIDKDLMVSELAYAMTVGTQHDSLSRDDLDVQGQFKVRRTAQEKVDSGAVTGVTYDLLGEVAAQASITRRTAAAILAKIHPAKFALYAKNPEEFIAKVAKLIVSEKATMVVDHVEYHAIDDEYGTTIFTERMPRNASSAMSVKKGIQDYVFPDSDGEAGFARDLDAADEVEVYAKLPRAFAIPTPVGNYSPDWAIAFKKGVVQHVYFVAETKGSLDSLEFRGVEEAKIACAKKLFNQANTTDVRYHEVTSYTDLLELVSGGME